jgi:7,8-dihydroneopterin aldolase/epimerase/oxygenase
MKPDTIEIRRLEITTHIGVPDDERSTEQTLLATVRMVPCGGFEGLHDDIKNTVDYYAVALELQALASSKPRNLIETLAREIAEHILQNHPVAAVDVTIEKHILPDTECVAVHLHRARV